MGGRAVRAATRDDADLIAVAVLDRDIVQRVGDLPVDRGRGYGRVERHVVVVGGERLQVGADLVAHIAARRHAVGTDNHDIHLAVLHQVAARVIDDQRVRHAMRCQFPGGKQALVARTRFVDPDLQRHAGIVRLVDRRQRGAVIDGGDPAGVAVGQHLHRPAELKVQCGQQFGAVPADVAIDRNVLFRDAAGLGPRGGGTLVGRQGAGNASHAIKRPAQVDGGRTCRIQRAMGGIK